MLAACGIGSSVSCSTDNSKKNSGSEQNQCSSKTQLLRTNEVEKSNSHFLRMPFESLSNINTGDRVCETKRTSTEQEHRSSSFANTSAWQRNNTTSTSTGFNAPLAKKFAVDNNSTPKPLSRNGADLLPSSSTPAFKSTDSTTVTHLSGVTNQSNSSQFPRNTPARDSQLQEFARSNFRSSSPCESNKRMDPSNKVSTQSNLTSNFSSKPELSGFHLNTGCKTLRDSKAIDVHTTSPVWQQRGPLRSSPAINNQTRHFPMRKGNTGSPLCNQTERSSPRTYNKSLSRTKAPETPLMFGQNTGTCTGSSTPQGNHAVASETPVMLRRSVSRGSSTPQGHQTPVVNRSHARTPSGSKTPKTRKFPGPAGLLPKLVCKISCLLTYVTSRDCFFMEECLFSFIYRVRAKTLMIHL